MSVTQTLSNHIYSLSYIAFKFSPTQNVRYRRRTMVEVKRKRERRKREREDEKKAYSNVMHVYRAHRL